MPPTPRGLCVFFFQKRARRVLGFFVDVKIVIGETTKDDVSHDDDDDDESERRGRRREEIVEDIKRKIEENKNEIQRREEMKYQSPPGVPRPPVVPVIEPGKFGFVENAEIMNSRASMIGWWSLLFVELVAGKGLLEMLGFTVGKGINFTF